MNTIVTLAALAGFALAGAAPAAAQQAVPPPPGAAPAAAPAPAPEPAPAPAPAPDPAPPPAAMSAPAATTQVNLTPPPPGGMLSRKDALLHSLMFPGLGQLKSDREMRGYVFAGLAGVAVITTVVLGIESHMAENKYESSELRYRHLAYEQAQSYDHAFNWSLATTIGIWAVNAAEAWFLYPGEK